MEWLDLQLSLEQKFLLKRVECDMHKMSREDLEATLTSTVQQLMVKDNVLKQFMKREIRGRMP